MGIAYNTSIVSDGLVFALDAANSRSYAGSGNTVYDLKNSSFSGSLVNGIGFTASNNGAFTFDGSNDYITFQPNSIFEFGTGNFTVLAWHKKPNSTDSTIISIDDGNGGGIILYTVIDGSLYNYVAGQWSDGTINVSDNTWKQVALVRSSGICQPYVNTMPDQSFAAYGSVATSGRSLTLGKIASAYYHNGSISQVMIYNRALTQQEIKQNFNATRDRYGI